MSAEPGDLVVWFLSEWVVDRIEGDIAYLRKPGDSPGDEQQQVAVKSLVVQTKAADR